MLPYNALSFNKIFLLNLTINEERPDEKEAI